MAILEKLRENNFTTKDNTTLYVDNEGVETLRKNMLSSVEKLVLDTSAFDMEDEINGTECVQELINQWHKVSETTDNYRNFYINHVDPAIIRTIKSVNDTAQEIADALDGDKDGAGKKEAHINHIESPDFKTLKNATNTIVEIKRAFVGNGNGVTTTVVSEEENFANGPEVLKEEKLVLTAATENKSEGNGTPFAGAFAPENTIILEDVNPAKQYSSGHAISKTELTKYRDDFTSRYAVDEKTMKKVDEYINDYKKTGNTSYLDKLKKYQNLSEEKWNNLSDKQYEEFTALSTLYAWSSYVVEHGGEGTEDIECYKEICGQMTSNMYSIKPLEKGSEYQVASLDSRLVYSMKTALSSVGASDSLAFNILSKVENDKNEYMVYDVQYQPEPKDVIVKVDYDESGFVDVNIEDSYVPEYPLHTKQFLAVGMDGAKTYMADARKNVSSYNNHGMKNNELIAMFQSVENPNDLQIMTNIATSDSNYKVNGEGNAFKIDYWEDDVSNNYNYSKGISDTFSVALAQMGATTLDRGNMNSYKSFVKATVESSINGSNHNILLDIATGAGIYVDTCSLAVVNDEIGGDNDDELRMALNAANANYGVFSQLYKKFDNDVTYTNLRISDITYNGLNGAINFNIKTNKEKGALWWKEEKKDKNIEIESMQEFGKIGTGDGEEDKEKKLKKELKEKKESIATDCIIDFTENINPLLKDGIHFVKDCTDGKESVEVVADSSKVVKDGMKSAFSDEKAFNSGLSCGSTVLNAFAKYEKAIKDYEKAKKECSDTKKLQTFYSYNTGSNTVGLYSYECIRKVQRWNQNGICEIVGEEGKSNDEIYESLRQDNDYSRAVVKIIAEDLCDEDFDDLGPHSGVKVKDAISDAYKVVKKQTGYTKEDIDCAMKVVVYGYSESGSYHEITDIPFDLQNACINAITKGADVDVYKGWEDYVSKIK